jgi:hypothetical protein
MDKLDLVFRIIPGKIQAPRVFLAQKALVEQVFGDGQAIAQRNDAHAVFIG